MSIESKEITLFHKFANLMEQNTKGVEIGCYSIAFMGLTFALRRVRPFARFKRPSDIPNHFIKERRELIGTVERVEPNGVLLINHKPLVYLPGIKQGELPAKIANVDINGHGISWLQILVAQHDVKFIPIAKKEKFVECQITLQQKTHDNKDRVIDLGVSLVSIGFGNLIESPIGRNNKDYKYYKQLLLARETALRKKMGYRYYVKPTKLVLAAIYHQLKVLGNSILNRIVKKPIVRKALPAA